MQDMFPIFFIKLGIRFVLYQPASGRLHIVGLLVQLQCTLMKMTAILELWVHHWLALSSHHLYFSNFSCVHFWRQSGPSSTLQQCPEKSSPHLLQPFLVFLCFAFLCFEVKNKIMAEKKMICDVDTVQSYQTA